MKTTLVFKSHSFWFQTKLLSNWSIGAIKGTFIQHFGWINWAQNNLLIGNEQDRFFELDQTKRWSQLKSINTEIVFVFTPNENWLDFWCVSPTHLQWNAFNFHDFPRILKLFIRRALLTTYWTNLSVLSWIESAIGQDQSSKIANS